MLAATNSQEEDNSEPNIIQLEGLQTESIQERKRKLSNNNLIDNSLTASDLLKLNEPYKTNALLDEYIYDEPSQNYIINKSQRPTNFTNHIPGGSKLLRSPVQNAYASFPNREHRQ